MDASLDNYQLSAELNGHSMDVRAVASGAQTPAGQLTVSGSRDKTVKVWSRTPTGDYVDTLTLKDHKGFIACVCYLPVEKWICSGSNDATVCIYGEGSYVPILRLEGHKDTVCAIAGGIEAQSLITGSWDKTARIWTINELGVPKFIELHGHEAAVWAVACMPAVKKFLTGSADKCIYYWNAQGEKLRMLKGHTDCVRGILALADNTLVSCANDAIIRYWNADGECVQELSGHSNYIYGVAQNRAVGEKVIVSCGEDSTLRMWDLTLGRELGDPIVHPAQSVWCVTCLSNGDIVTGSSDGILRVFTKDPERFAHKSILNAFTLAVSTRTEQINQDLGGIKKTDLPGPEALLTNGTREGQTKMIRHPNGTVKCYSWEDGNWKCLGTVTGASGGSQDSSGKTLYEGKEYDYVFSVDISDTQPAIKLPYNKGEDPWTAAQAFIHRHNLPQAYLDQVANFIITNSGGSAAVTTTDPPSGFHDPFTGGARYVPGSSNNNFDATGTMDPFTGGSSYRSNAAMKAADTHFPVSKYVTFDNCDAVKVLEKLREFNSKLSSDLVKVSDTLLQTIINLTDATPFADKTSIEALRHLLGWPNDVLFPVLDVTRLAIRNEAIFVMLNSLQFLDVVLPQLRGSAPNQLMAVRCMANMMCHAAGRKEIEVRLPKLVEEINVIKSGSGNLQIAVATFYLNVTVSQMLGVPASAKCFIATEGIVELLKWITDLEASYRTIQAIGNMTTTPFGPETTALVVSVDYVMDKLRGLTNTPQTGQFAKLNSAGTALLAAL